ncbi:MAG: Nre family DNA repair protein [Candidatus Nanoarchaeia archaeon]
MSRRGGKAAFLHKLTSKMQHFESINIGQKIEGSTPPSVFIGKFGYPKVFAGPLISQQHGDTSILDMPEVWIPEGKFSKEIVNFRLQLVRGKAIVGIKELDNKLVSQLQEIALAKSSTEAEAQFKSKPRGVLFNEEYQPFGPSAPLQKLEVANVKWNPQLEKVYYDTDLKASEGIKLTYEKGLLFSQIQKAFSVGAMGLGKNRKLVPTRWSITAVDDTLGRYLLESVKQFPVLDIYQVYEFKSMENYFAILLMPTLWQYENFEAFIHVIGNEIVLFSDWEPYTGRKTYSEQGGCYYSARFAIAEHLNKIKKQAGAIVFREAYPNYIPLGVWNVRENIRTALKQQPKEFFTLKDSLDYIRTKLALPIEKFIRESKLLRHVTQQTMLNRFF